MGKPPFKITRESNTLSRISVEHEGSNFHATFTTGDPRASNAAADILIEKICGFSKFDIFMAIAEFDQKFGKVKGSSVASDNSLVVDEPREVGPGSDETPIPFGG